MRRPSPTLPTVFLVALLLAGRGFSGTRTGGGNLPTDPPGTDAPKVPDGPIDHRGGAGDVVMEVDVGPGGFSPNNPVGRSLPTWRLYGDGTLISVSGDQSIYQNRTATPEIQVTRISETEVQQLLRLAGRADLRGNAEPDFGDPKVTDLGSTSFRVITDGGTAPGAAYGLDLDDEELDGISDHQRVSRKVLQKLVDQLDRYAQYHPRTYRPPAWAVIARSVDLGHIDTGDRIETWPLSDPAHGRKTNTVGRCVDLSDDQFRVAVAGVPDALKPEPEIVAWETASGLWELGFRPLLPGESGCDDLDL